MIVFITVLFFVTSCSICRKGAATVVVRDSIRTEVRESVRYLHDTIVVSLPVEIEKVVVTDSSHLENSFAISDASVDVAGRLHHSLESRNTSMELPFERSERVRDSIVYVEKFKNIEVPVFVQKPLTWWQQIQIKGFRVLLLIIVALVVFRIVPFIRKVL